MVELFRYLKAALCASKRLLSGGEILLVSTSGSKSGSMLVSLDLQDIDAHSVTGSLEIRGYLFGFDTTCRTVRARDGCLTIGGSGSSGVFSTLSSYDLIDSDRERMRARALPSRVPTRSLVKGRDEQRRDKWSL